MPTCQMMFVVKNRNPVATTHIFKEVKRNFEDADLSKALAAGAATDAAQGEEDPREGSRGGCGESAIMSEEEATKAAMDMLKKMPGIDENNVRQVVNGIECIADLAEMTEEQLSALVGPVNAKKLFVFLKSTLSH